MAVNTLGQYTGNYKVWDHVGNVTPDFVVSEGDVPSEELRAASWLPVQLWDKYFEVWKVMTAGKAAALDNAGRVVPAGMTSITYTADDVTAGTIDVRTGVALVAGGIGTVAVSGVTTFMGGTETLSVSDPIGMALYDYYQDAGDAGTYDDGTNPVGFKQHNFRLQHLVAVITHAYIELPLVPATQTATNLGQLTKASSVNILDGAALGNLPVAKNTIRTPITFTNGTGSDVATRFVSEVESRSMIKHAGDWYINLDTGVISVYGTGTILTNVYQVSYYHYASAPGTVSKFACAVGDLQPGQWVKPDGNANMQLDAAPGVGDTLGQVWAIHKFPRDLMEYVRSGHKPPLATSATGLLPGYSGQYDQTAGSATGGVPTKIHFAGASDSLVRINLCLR